MMDRACLPDLRLLEGHVLAGLGLPVFGKCGVVLNVQFACRVVGDVEKRDGLLCKAWRGQAGKCTDS
jgi:hypothetical protein